MTPVWKIISLLALCATSSATCIGRCHNGERGERGPRGPAGPPPTVTVLAPGIECPTGGLLIGGLPLCNPLGSVIPYASGTSPVVLSTTATGVARIGAMIGFGSSSSNLALQGSIVAANATVGDFAFTAPRNLTLTSLYFDYTNTLAVTLITATSLVVRVQVYEAPTGSNTYSPLALFATGTLPAPSFVVSAGQTTHGHAFASIPIVAGTRLLLVASVTAPSATALTVTTGILSAGLGFL